MMKTAQVMLKFDAAKLKALEFYLPQNGTSVEEELRGHLDEIYKNEVPDAVKEFIRFQSNGREPDNVQEKNAPDQTKTTADSSKPACRLKVGTQKTETPVPKAEPVPQTESPEMGMKL